MIMVILLVASDVTLSPKGFVVTSGGLIWMVTTVRPMQNDEGSLTAQLKDRHGEHLFANVFVFPIVAVQLS
jgi:hypothetical protein